MAIYLAIIITLGGGLLVVTAYMEWVGLLNVVTPRSAPRHPDCGHLRTNPVSPHDRCWRCRHHDLDHLVHPIHR
jgi:hypothetical protein